MTKERQPRVARAIALSLPGGLALLLAMPIAAMPWYGPSLVMLAIAAPFYIGLMAAPGFVYAALFGDSARSLEPRRRWWIRLSLYGVLLCSAGGVYGGTLMALFLPPSLVSGAIAVFLLYRFEKRR